ncbi:(2Fe-2S) ferredoxin domain-containing protein [Treponema sp. HNW]|uniref:(2Fe-2S) ferredoxin domain-containing protein n=1 Tax=Treponema sp. HNW TaxID=3116654 RepID=UPI003D122901
MAKMSLEELRKLRGEKQNELKRRDTDGKTMQIIVGMGTCGIAAGAKDTLDAFVSELTKNGLSEHAIIRQTGCMGLCASEPTVELIIPDMPTVMYGKVKADKVAEIVKTHIVEKKLIDNMILNRPSADILNQ